MSDMDSLPQTVENEIELIYEKLGILACANRWGEVQIIKSELRKLFMLGQGKRGKSDDELIVP